MSSRPERGSHITAEITIKRSRFIADLARADTEDQARQFIAEIRSAHPDARHHCLAYVVTDDGVQSAHSSDDGEPAGTAGVPMLQCLLKTGLENVVVVVTRYFGGVKLGAGGLVRAYTDAVSLAVSQVRRVTVQTRQVWEARLPHTLAGRTQEEILRGGGSLLDQAYDDQGLELRFTFPGDPSALFARLTGGSVRPATAGCLAVELPAS